MKPAACEAATGRFVHSVAVAVAVGWLAGWLNLLVRRRISDPAGSTVLSFAVPFAASVPAARPGASGLVAAVVAGLVTPLLGVLAHRARRTVGMQPRIQKFHDDLSTPEGRQQTLQVWSARGRKISGRDVGRFAKRVTRGLATIEYFVREPLGWREGTAVVWAGMRAAVTVAAARTLPDDTPQRPVLVLLAFAVAALSLAVQGGTIGPLLRVLPPAPAGPPVTPTELDRIMVLLKEVAAAIPAPQLPAGDPAPEMFMIKRDHRPAVIAARRPALLDARDHGTFDAGVLTGALINLDAAEIAIELRGKLAAPAG